MSDRDQQQPSENLESVLQDEHGPASPDPVRLVPGRSDVELAADLKKRADAAKSGPVRVPPPKKTPTKASDSKKPTKSNP